MSDSLLELSNLSVYIDFEDLPDPTTKYELHDVIGEGTYGEVYSAKDRETDKWVAVKVLENIRENMKEIEVEYLALRDLCLHPNIPTFHGLYLKRSASDAEDDQLWFVMELCDGGSVTVLVNGLQKIGKCLSERQIAYILKEVVDALCYLHANHFMHRDVKGHNILLTDEAHVKLVDFGVSSHLSTSLGHCNTSVGTPYWMAPEVIACEQQCENSYDVRCDVWSVGITAIEMGDGNPPLADLHPMRALFQIPRNPPPSLQSANKWSFQFNDFISECLIKDFEQRPVVRELLEHPFIAQVNGNEDQVRRQLKGIIGELQLGGQLTKRRTPEVTTKHGKLKYDRKSKHQPMFVDDLVALENFTEEVVLEQLYERYCQNQIYTYIGDILLAINPFQDLGQYGPEQCMKYCNRARSDNPPHIFAVADTAYHSMLHYHQNQCIVISGESGAGKTESANLLLKQLVALGKAVNRNLEEKILLINPIMEAFGNAHTGLNANSSRFGKFLDLSFTKVGKVTGARIRVYLLEYSRVVFQTPGESNFHILNFLYDGLESQDLLDVYKMDLHRRRTHRYLCGDSRLGGCEGDDPIAVKLTNSRRFNTISKYFKLLGFTTDEVDAVYRVLAGILNLGDLTFDTRTLDGNIEASIVVEDNILDTVSHLLAISAIDLSEALTTKSVVTRGEIIKRHNGLSEATFTRDAMAKVLYGRLFDWIVSRMNRLLSVENHYVNCTQLDEPLEIGILDIFGFENFAKNSFEQMCINIANEQLQYFFNQHVFKWEQQEYMSEGIEVNIIKFCDNRPVLDLFLAKPIGLLALLDEESHFPRATDVSLVEKFHNNVKSPYYRGSFSNSLLFSVQHYAGLVTYNAENFLDKNRNYLPLEVIQTLRHSKYEIIRSLFQFPLTRTGNLHPISERTVSVVSKDENFVKKNIFCNSCKTKELVSQTRAKQTSAAYFRYSLMDLLQKMVHVSSHFVRCIKPNRNQCGNQFDRQLVRVQLACTGVLEAVHIRQQGYSHRLTFADFIKRYYWLAFGFDERVVVNRDNCRLLLLRLKMDGWAIGKTKVFLKYYHVEFLSRLHENNFRKIILVQSCIRRWLAKVKAEREYWITAKSALTLQKYTRGWLARKKMYQLQCSMSGSLASTVEESARRDMETEAKVVTKMADLEQSKAANVIKKYFLKWRANRNISQQVKRISAGNVQEIMALSQQVYFNNQQSHKQQRASNVVLYGSPTSSSSPPVNLYSNLIIKEETNASVGAEKSLQCDSVQRSNSSNAVSPEENWDTSLQKMERSLLPKKLVEIKENDNSLAPPEDHHQKKQHQQQPLVGLDSPECHKRLDEKVLPRLMSSAVARRPANRVFGRQWEPLQCEEPTGRDFLQSKSSVLISEEDAGPYDFKKMLRKTNYAPTDSIRQRKSNSVESSERSLGYLKLLEQAKLRSTYVTPPIRPASDGPLIPRRLRTAQDLPAIVFNKGGHQEFIRTYQNMPKIQINYLLSGRSN